MDSNPDVPSAARPFPLSPAPFAKAIEGAARALERRTEETPGYPDLWNRMGLFFSAMWQHALTAGLVSPRADPHRLEALRLHWMLVPLLYGLAFALAWIDSRLSIGIYVVLLLYYALPGPAVLRWTTGRGAARQAALKERARTGAERPRRSARVESATAAPRAQS